MATFFIEFLGVTDNGVFLSMESFSIYAVFNNTEKGLFGNTAAVVTYEELPSKRFMQRIASDLNQPATTFLAPADKNGHYFVRWFAPDAEIGLCGHGTLAAIAHLGAKSERTIHLIAGKNRLSGRVIEPGLARMELDSIQNTGNSEIPDGLESALGVTVQGYYPTSNKDIVLLQNESDLVRMKPDFQALRKIKVFGYAVTAEGNTSDFVSRTLVPHVQQLEDHATGSSHAALAPFWSERLDKTSLTAIQHSKRGGYFECEIKGDKTVLTGFYTMIASGKLQVGETVNL